MLKEFDQDTIAAIATPPGEGAVGIVRLSGEKAIEIADRIFESKKGRSVKSQKSFTVQYGHIVEKNSPGKIIIDEVLLTVMRAPKSFTTEDVVEISCHGGRAVLSAILALALKNGARLAQKGEFTKRAYLSGRIDLLQAEAVLDMIKAKTNLGSQWASQQLEGALSGKVRKIKDELVLILSHLEASIDFPDDFPETDSNVEIEKKLSEICRELKQMALGAGAGKIMKSGLKVAIAGRPNVGKSSLMNALVRANRVIVTPIPGTTRDVIEEEIVIGGFPIFLSDTAGLRQTDHPIEIEGIERSKQAVSASDMVLYVIDRNQPFLSEDQLLLEGLKDRSVILVLNKSDLPSKINREDIPASLFPIEAVDCSCVKEPGTKLLEDKIVSIILESGLKANAEVPFSSIRQTHLIQKALKAVDSALRGVQEARSPELIAVDIRSSLDELGLIVGEVINDEMLDVLFDQFCIGK